MRFTPSPREPPVPIFAETEGCSRTFLLAPREEDFLSSTRIPTKGNETQKEEKYITKNIITLASVMIAFTFGTGTAFASHHHEKAIKELIKDHFQFLTDGEHQKAYSHMHSEARGFLPNGSLLLEFPSGESRKMFVKQRTNAYEKGRRYRLTPKHINVMVDEDGNCAFATHYTEGTITHEGKDGEKEHVRDRGTVIFTKEDGQWKVIHWHASPIKSAAEDD